MALPNLGGLSRALEARPSRALNSAFVTLCTLLYQSSIPRIWLLPQPPQEDHNIIRTTTTPAIAIEMLFHSYCSPTTSSILAPTELLLLPKQLCLLLPQLQLIATTTTAPTIIDIAITASIVLS